MALIVQKYGGTSVADPDRIRAVADNVAITKKRGNDVVVVVSAMGKATDNLIALADSVSTTQSGREMDMLLTTGERQTAALLTMALADRGIDAISYTGSQVGIITDTAHRKAKIVEVKGDRVRAAIADGKVAVIAGFQGVSTDREITTMGRGASDLTASALAQAMSADACEIYTDVDGVFTADPRIAPQARQVPTITYEEMLELAANGAKVLHLRCVEYARRFDLPIHVRSSFSDKTGTLVVSDSSAPEGEAVEQPIIAGVAHDLADQIVTHEFATVDDAFDLGAELGVMLHVPAEDVADADVYKFLRYFTFLSLEEISAVEEADNKAEGKPQGQAVLAREATRLVHGEDGLAAALRITEALFTGDPNQLPESDFEQLCLDGMPSSELPVAELADKPLTSLLMDCGMAKAGREVKDALGRQSVFINGRAIGAEQNMKAAELFDSSNALFGRFFLVRLGKKKYHLLQRI